MRRKILPVFSYIVLYALIIFLADFYRQPLFLFLLMLLLALPPVSYFLCRAAFRALSVSVQSTVISGRAGDTVRLCVSLHDPTVFPLPDCCLTYQITSAFYPCDTLFRITIPACLRADFSFTLPVTFEKSGCYRIALKELTTQDYLHFFPFRKSLAQQKEILIFPVEGKDVSFDPASFGEGFDEFEETDRRGLISSNVTDIRAYIPGDRPQSIHWKLSAKIDKLMVKEHEQTSSHQFLILVDLYLPSPGSDVLEHAISNAYSLSRAMLQSGETFFFCYFNRREEEFYRHMVTCSEDLWQALHACFYQQPYDIQDMARNVLERSAALQGTILYVTEKGVTNIVS